MDKASLLSRLVALIIDVIILGVISWILSLILGQEIGGLIGFIIGISYQIYFLSQQKGQTPGKKVMGIRVVKTDGSPIDPMSAGLRYIGYYINTLLLFIGWLWAIPDGNNQGFHDKIAGTYVVKA
jgi:uncharacterized RDD family membrane protein YckC